MPVESLSHADLASEILGLLGHDPRDASAPEVTAETFRRCTRDQLLELAGGLGLTGVSKLSKDLLAGRVQMAFASLPRAAARPVNGTTAAAAGEATETTETEISFHKFDLGQVADERP